MKRVGVHDTSKKAIATMRTLLKEAADMGQLGNLPLRWYNDPGFVPVPKAILLDILETTYPESMFGLLIHPNDPPIYEIHWRGEPSPADLQKMLDSSEVIRGKTMFILSHQDLTEIVPKSKPARH